MITRIRNVLKPLALSILISIPAKCPEIWNPMTRDVFQHENVAEISKNLTSGLNKIVTKNFRGGLVYKFDSCSVAILKQRLMKDKRFIKYTFPLEGCKHPYTENFGHFFAKRPGSRKHLGLDIFVTPYAVKPKNPVKVLSPVDGVVIMEKHSRKYDNVISNAITILGRDGKRYCLDHLANKKDYKTYIELPKLGTYLKSGDSVGYIGNTGETSLWHLHFSVMTDEQLKYQLHNKMWLDFSKKSDYSKLSGQVNPLSEKDAGRIANVIKSNIKDRK